MVAGFQPGVRSRHRLGPPVATTGCRLLDPDLSRRLEARHGWEHLWDQPGHGGWEEEELDPAGFCGGGEPLPHLHRKGLALTAITCAIAWGFLCSVDR